MKNMELKNMLEYIEKRLESTFKSPLIKSAWLVNVEGFEKEDFAHISFIINNTKKGYTKELNHIKKKLDILKKDRKIKFQFTLYPITDYWDKLRYIDPDLLSEMRLSIILYDPSGFFAPLKILLIQGKIPCTREAVQVILKESPQKILKVHNELKREIISSLYNLTIDAAQAPIVLAGYDPPIPRNIPPILDNLFVKKKLLKKSSFNICSEIITYYKDIEHGKIKQISGNDLHIFLEASELFIKDMEELMKKIAKNPQSSKKSTTTR